MIKKKILNAFKVEDEIVINYFYAGEEDSDTMKVDKSNLLDFLSGMGYGIISYDMDCVICLVDMPVWSGSEFTGIDSIEQEIEIEDFLDGEMVQCYLDDIYLSDAKSGVDDIFKNIFESWNNIYSNQ